MMTRREFIKNIITAIFMVTIGRDAKAEVPVRRKRLKEARSTLYRAVNGAPDLNLTKAIELMGGIEKIIGHRTVGNKAAFGNLPVAQFVCPF